MWSPAAVLRLQTTISQPRSVTAAKGFNLDHKEKRAKKSTSINDRWRECGRLFLLLPSNNGRLPAWAFTVILCSIGGLCSTVQRQQSAERSTEAPADSMPASAGKWHNSSSSKMNDRTTKFLRQEMEDDSRSVSCRAAANNCTMIKNSFLTRVSALMSYSKCTAHQSPAQQANSPQTSGALEDIKRCQGTLCPMLL